MSDMGEITALVHSYALLLDGGDIEGVTALFTNATWRSEPGGRALRGRDEVRPIYAQVKLYDGIPRTKHLLTNLTVDVEPGASSASAHCYFTVLQGVEPGHAVEIILSGQYVDTFEKVEGTWRFADRLIKSDLTGDLSKHMG
jgi:hypothetical protein